MQKLYVKIRKCGFPKEGGVYLLGGVYSSKEGATQKFIRISPPILYPVKVHRTARIVDGDAIINRLPMDTWWKGSSARTEQRKRIDMWSMDMFGMPIEKRFDFGECEGVHDIDACIYCMTCNLEIDALIVLNGFRDLSSMEVGSMPKMAGHYDNLRTALLTLAEIEPSEETVGYIMYAQAIVWKMAYSVNPPSYEKVIPALSSILFGLGFKKDAIAIRKTFLGD